MNQLIDLLIHGNKNVFLTLVACIVLNQLTGPCRTHCHVPCLLPFLLWVLLDAELGAIAFRSWPEASPLGASRRRAGECWSRPRTSPPGGSWHRARELSHMGLGFCSGCFSAPTSLTVAFESRPWTSPLGASQRRAGEPLHLAPSHKLRGVELGNQCVRALAAGFSALSQGPVAFVSQLRANTFLCAFQSKNLFTASPKDL